MWTLVPLGNPGPEYADTRHNLGRLLLQRWMEDRNLNPPVVKKFASGRLYGLSPKLQALVPSTYMNLSGEVCFQAARAGLDPRKLILLYDDKDLPLGLGRFRLDGIRQPKNEAKTTFRGTLKFQVEWKHFVQNICRCLFPFQPSGLSGRKEGKALSFG